MIALTKAVAGLEEIGELMAAVEAGKSPVSLTGAAGVHRAVIFAAMRREMKRPMLILCGDDAECARLAGDLEGLTGEDVSVLSAREMSFRASAIASREWEQRRIAALYNIVKGRAKIVVATPDALLQKCMPRDVLKSAAVKLELGKSYDISALAEQLLRAGYSRCEQVEGAGQFALRGGILDVFSPGNEMPIRCEFFDDEIDSMGEFDTATQRRVKNVKTTLVLPASEVLFDYAPGGRNGLADKLDAQIKKSEKKVGNEALCRTLREDAERLREGSGLAGADKYFCPVYPKAETAVGFFNDDTVVCIAESGRVTERAKNYLWQLKEDIEIVMAAGILAGEWAHFAESAEMLWKQLEEFPVCMAETLPTSRYPMRPRTLLTLTAKQLSSYGGSLDAALSDMRHYLGAGYSVVMVCAGGARERNIKRTLDENDIPNVVGASDESLAPGRVYILTGALSAGAEFPTVKLAVLTEGQMAAPMQKKKRATKSKNSDNRQKIRSYADLHPGDLVVHTYHGIGRFEGIQRMPVDGVEKDYIKICYAGSDSLYVPATQLDLVSKYIGGGEDNERVRLNKLGGTDWARAKIKAKAAAKDLAAGLIKLYAERQKLKGHAFPPDTPWQKEFEECFDFDETEDQLRCIDEIKQDMESTVPMDRLLCGDVGFGKTEVALRAVMKCIMDGRQAAILVPTTVLARQHFATATSRFRRFPVKIALLSRFQSAKDSKRILEELEAGTIDILIGTHRLLQKSIKFKKLGLLVIDEEQRFGVTHKEKLKEMAKQVDTLTLTATPIPRTLNMALSGIRSMSVIETPPRDRQPVQTYVLEHDWGIVADAMRREISRGGQVYYLHNRVETIDRTAAKLQQILGENVNIAVAHGKMSEAQISDAMNMVIEGEAQVLVCTTIIETGIDIPNVNTMIIEDADHLGLAQLHQLRGRIGRSARRGFAYLTYRRGKVLSEVANKRLSAIREYVEFGSGFKIAMRDLEIRGAGNLLGPEQSGYMMSVGYDMYLALLEEAVLEEQGKTAETHAECSADLTVSANIPEKYVASSEQRMDLYRRIAAIRSEGEGDDLLDEIMDRYGEPPRAVYTLLDVALLRAAASKGGITDVSQKGDTINFTFAEATEDGLRTMSEVAGRREYKGRVRFLAGEKPRLALKVAKGGDVLEQAREFAALFAPGTK